MFDVDASSIALQALQDATSLSSTREHAADAFLALGTSPDLTYVSFRRKPEADAQSQNPAPRLAILQALSNPDAFITPGDDDEERGGPLKETEVLHSLWESAGKSINLWDWLEGFRMSLVSKKRAADEAVGDPTTPSKGKRRREAADEDEPPELDEEEDARAHARWIRFVEEARMMGLVRAKGKKGDEVVKAVLL